MKKKYYLLMTDDKSDNPMQDIAGGAEITPFCFKYLMPYDDFPDIRHTYEYLICYTPFGPSKRCVMIDFSEWIGHENEEHLDIFLKYLADHNPKYISRWIMYVRTTDKEGGERLLGKVKAELGESEIKTYFSDRKYCDDEDQRIRG